MSEMDAMTPFDGFSDNSELALPGAAPARGDAPKQKSLMATFHRHMRGRYLMVLPFALVFGVAGAYLGWKSQKPLYRSDAAIQIKYKMPVLPGPGGTSNNETLIGAIPMYDEFMATQYYVITSRRVISQALRRPEWQNTDRGDDLETIKMFFDNLLVEHPRQTQTIHIAFTDRDPGVAAAGANAITHTYEDLYKGNDESIKDTALQNLDTKQFEKDRNILAKRDEMNRLARENYGTQDVEPIYQMRRTQFMELEQKKDQLNWILAQREAKGDVNKIIDDLTDTQIGMTDPVMAQKIAIRDQAQQQMAQLEATVLRNNPKLVEARAAYESTSKVVEEYGTSFRDLQKKLANGVDLNTNAGGAGTEGLAQRLTMSKEALQKEIGAVDKLYNDQKIKVDEIGHVMQTLNDDRDELKVLETDLENIKHEKEAFLFMMSGPERLQVLNYGEVPVGPMKDNRKKVAVAGGMGGMLLPVLACIGLSLVSKRYRFSDDAQAGAGMPPLLGILPTLPDKLSDPEQAAIAAHCIHQLRIMLQVNGGAVGSNGASSERRVYMITSASAGDGKTSLTMALGLSFAASGSRTLVVDCDMVGQGLTNRLKARSSEGLQEALCAGTLQGRVKKTTTPNLYILPIGGADSGHAGALSPVSIRRLLTEARRIFDVVIIDTGPVLGSLEAQVISAAADSVILTIARGQHHGLVERSVRLLQQVGARVAGMVFNRAEQRDFQRSVGSSSIKSISTTPRSQRMLIADGAEESRFGPLARSVASFMPSNAVKELPAKSETKPSPGGAAATDAAGSEVVQGVSQSDEHQNGEAL
jgi:capsular exopolysaccharide synthesis family protein